MPLGHQDRHFNRLAGDWTSAPNRKFLEPIVKFCCHFLEAFASALAVELASTFVGWNFLELKSVLKIASNRGMPQSGTSRPAKCQKFRRGIEAPPSYWFRTIKNLKRRSS
jgi:hypothetical protein